MNTFFYILIQVRKPSNLIGALFLPTNRDANSSAQTAITYRSCARVLFNAKSNYEIAILENVTALNQKPSEASLSDTEFIVDDFKMHNWSCIAADINAKDYGSAANRVRTIFIAMKGSQKQTGKCLTEECVFGCLQCDNQMPMGW